MMNDFEGKDVVGSYFLSLWRWKSKNAADSANADNDGEEAEEIPKQLDNPSEFATLSEDKLTVCYRSESSEGHGVGLVRANCPAPVNRLLYYFEIRVVNARRQRRDGNRIHQVRWTSWDCSALFLFDDPKSTSVGFLLDDAHRAYVADAVNAKILSTNLELKDERSCVRSYLERLLRQVRACSLEIQSLNGNRGEAFDLQKLLFS